MQTKRAAITLCPTVLTFLPLVTCRRNPFPFVAKIQNLMVVRYTLCATAAQCQSKLLVSKVLTSPRLFVLLHSYHALLQISGKVHSHLMLYFGSSILHAWLLGVSYDWRGFQRCVSTRGWARVNCWEKVQLYLLCRILVLTQPCSLLPWSQRHWMDLQGH